MTPLSESPSVNEITANIPRISPVEGDVSFRQNMENEIIRKVPVN